MDAGRGVDLARASRSILGWFARNGRDLPFRRTRDPYRILVSEAILQQTRMETGLRYYAAFLRRFPTLRALARAPLGSVLEAWAGMGYYARARHLHAAARAAARLGGLPATARALERLPGIGPYTAAAVASFAFGEDVLCVDGNVERILSRLFALPGARGSAVLRRRVRERAAGWPPKGTARDFNAALMDLGALVCRPRAPACGECPLSPSCRARALGRPGSFPARKPARPKPAWAIGVALIEGPKGVLLARRPARGSLGGLWELPGGRRRPGEALDACVRREVRKEIGLDVRVGGRLAVVRHEYTHARLALHAFRCRILRGSPRARGCGAVRWVRPAALFSMALPAAAVRILEAAGFSPRAGRRMPAGARETAAGRP